MPKKRSKILAAIHATAEGLHAAGAIDQVTMTATIKEFTKDFTREERAKVAARTAKLIEEELKLRENKATS